MAAEMAAILTKTFVKMSKHTMDTVPIHKFLNATFRISMADVEVSIRFLQD